MAQEETPGHAPQAPPAAPAAVRRILLVWHRTECWLAVACFGLIAALLLTDVLGRELVGPVLRAVGIDLGPMGLFGSQRVSVYALIVGSFAGIGIATATGSHLVPRVGFGWVPKSWDARMDRLASALTGLTLLAVAWYGWVFVDSSRETDLRAAVLGWPVWPMQMAIPLGFLSAAGRYFLYAGWPATRPQPAARQD
ncbi:MAG: TRAP transporter small permease subunit [Quisquiliibacterium sp.]